MSVAFVADQAMQMSVAYVTMMLLTIVNKIVLEFGEEILGRVIVVVYLLITVEMTVMTVLEHLMETLMKITV